LPTIISLIRFNKNNLDIHLKVEVTQQNVKKESAMCSGIVIKRARLLTEFDLAKKTKNEIIFYGIFKDEELLCSMHPFVLIPPLLLPSEINFNIINVNIFDSQMFQIT
jgi:hypothetical protein